MVLPWPGESACTAPHANAARMSSSSAPLPAAASAKTPAKPSPERSVVVCPPTALGAVSVPAPGDTAKVAVRSASGLESMSFG